MEKAEDAKASAERQLGERVEVWASNKSWTPNYHPVCGIRVARSSHMLRRLKLAMEKKTEIKSLNGTHSISRLLRN